MTALLPDRVTEASTYLRGRCNTVPRAGIILGTGLGGLAEKIQVETVVDYGDIPHFPVSTVEHHEGKWIFGTLGNTPVVAMQGRFHLYEGYSLEQVTFPVRVFKALGAEIMVVSNACGGISERLPPGTVMAIEDHLNLLGTSPLVGPNFDSLGPRWPDMSEPYDRALLDLALDVAGKLDISLPKGVYACMSGPQLETRAEYRMLRSLGADVVGMSTVPEVIVAAHAGLRVLGLSVVTDECVPERLRKANITDIIAHAKKAEPQLIQIILGVLERLAGPAN